MMGRIHIFLPLLGVLFVAGAYATPRQYAELIVLNKVSAQSELRKVPVGEAVLVGSFSLLVKVCDKAPPEDPPESGAYLDIVQKGEKIFEGWMFASDPALNSMEHPVYDIWLQRCL